MNATDKEHASSELLRDIFSHLPVKQRLKIARDLIRGRDAFIGNECEAVWLPVKQAKIDLWNNLCTTVTWRS